MTWTPQTHSPLAYFAMLVADDDDFPLLETVASLAMDEYPDLDLNVVPNALDRLVQRLHRRVPAKAAPVERLRVLNQYFFVDLGFQGNLNNYYDPDNSYVHQVLATRRGIPISLAVIWLELANSLDLQAHGVSFPGHFLCKLALPEGQVVVDPFAGATLSREDLSERAEPFKAQFGLTGDNDAPVDSFLQPASNRDIVVRVLSNLREIHRSHDDSQRELAVHERLVLVSPKRWEYRRDRGLCAARLGDKRSAARDLSVYLREVPTAPDAPQVSAALLQLQQS